MAKTKSPKYFATSMAGHTFILLVLLIGLDFTTPLPVFENTNHQDIISAVILGDTPDSKILPHKPMKETVPVPTVEPAKRADTKPVSKDVIALKALDKKKLAEEKALEAKKQREQLAKNLLADIKTEKIKRKKIHQKQLKKNFEKTLHEQAEKSLRQQLLNEEIKLESNISRQAQGEVNKYIALIRQAISEHWIIPPQADKSLHCVLRIRLEPNGTVLDVQITQSSGDVLLDRSARSAVFQASPLPVPKDEAALKPFREFLLKVKPENIIATKAVADPQI